MHLLEQVPSPQAYHTGRMSLADRFWPKVVAHENACWEWIGDTEPGGYGRMLAYRLPGKKGKVEKATHVMWFLCYGVWPTTNVLHSCDNPPCTNPAHLSEGSKKRNAEEAVARKRLWQTQVTHCPEGHPYDLANTVMNIRKSGKPWRGCRTCRKIQDRLYKSKRKCT
jgi:hypothetical protein